jgi:hypothetical protein
MVLARVLVTSVVLFALPPSILFAQVSTLTGTITDASTGAAPDPLNIRVTTCLADGTICRSESPDASGHYIIPFLSPGSRYVRIYTPSSYVGELFDHIPCVASDCGIQDGTLVTLAGGETRTIDFTLTRAGHIAGTVTNAATGAPLSSQVFVYNAQTSLVTSAPADASGHYDVGGLATGSYFVLAALAMPFYAHVAGGDDCLFACRIASGALFAVTAGATTTVDVALTATPPTGQISGHVTDAATGAPIAGSIQLQAGSPSGFSAVAAADGSYTISNVSPGTYTATLTTDAFVDFLSRFRSTVAATRSVVVAAGVNVQLDFAVTRFNGSIAGSLNPVAGPVPADALGTGSAVRIYDRDGNLVKYALLTFASGSSRWPATYLAKGLAPGTYYVRYVDEVVTFHSLLVAGGTALDQTFGLGPCIAADCDVRRGTPIQVGPDTAVAGVDLPVVAGGSIEATPVTGAALELYDSRGVRIDPQLQALRSTAVALLTLPPDTYFLRVAGVDCSDCAATSLRPIQVHAGERVTIALSGAPPVRHLTGTIRDSTMTPLSTISVTVLDTRQSLSSLSPNAQTDMLGQYMAFVGPGTYIVRTSNARGFVDAASAPITVGATDVTGVDLVLDHATGLVLATATDADGVPLLPSAITYFDASGHATAHATTSSGGPVATSLPPGTYFARTDPMAGRVMELYGGLPCAGAVCDPTSGSPINVTGGSPASISFVVPACGVPDVSPSLLASAVVGHPYRQVLSSSHPSSGFIIITGTLPAGMSLDLRTGVLAGTPTEGGVFSFTVAAVDGAGCAGTRIYTLQVAQCAFTVSPASATVSASGEMFDITASDVCGFASVTPADPWVTVSAASVTSGVPLHVTVAPSTSPASRTSTIVIGRRIFSIRQPGRQPSPPFGSLDGPADGALATGSIAVGGWALDDVEITHVRIFRDAVESETGPLVFIGDAVFVDGARPDIERAYPTMPNNSRAGWGYLLLTNMLPHHGNGTFRLHAVAEDAEGNTTELGTRMIVAANDAATAPFGAIDTPGQGEIVSGAAYVNFGWALTPQPKSIPLDGSTIHVLIDGVDSGTVKYNNFRDDVSTLFPGLANSSGPVGFFVLDTTRLADGVHTIAWVVTDSAGAPAGIGSRFFTVRNSADAQPAALHAK